VLVPSQSGGRFGVLELPACNFRVFRAADGVEIEIPRLTIRVTDICVDLHRGRLRASIGRTFQRARAYTMPDDHQAAAWLSTRCIAGRAERGAHGGTVRAALLPAT
jgi:hypothetical protein